MQPLRQPLHKLVTSPPLGVRGTVISSQRTDKQTDRQTYRHADRNTLQTYYNKIMTIIIKKISQVRGLTVDSSQVTFVPTSKSRDTKN